MSGGPSPDAWATCKGRLGGAPVIRISAIGHLFLYDVSFIASAASPPYPPSNRYTTNPPLHEVGPQRLRVLWHIACMSPRNPRPFQWPLQAAFRRVSNPGSPPSCSGFGYCYRSPHQKKPITTTGWRSIHPSCPRSPIHLSPLKTSKRR